MTYYCKFCDKSRMNKSKYNILKSIAQRKLEESFIRRCINPNPIFEQIYELMKRYNNIFNKKYEKCLFSCVLETINYSKSC